MTGVGAIDRFLIVPALEPMAHTVLSWAVQFTGFVRLTAWDLPYL